MDNIYRGNSVVMSVDVKDDAGNPFDLTGWTLQIMFKVNTADENADAVIDKSFTSHTDAVNGKTSINLTPDETEVVDAGTYQYEITLTNTSNVITVIVGKVKILEPVRDPVV